VTARGARIPIILVVVIAIVVAVGCERPFDRTPAGYAEACYGGRADAARNWVCSEDRLVVTLEATQAEWRLLAKIVSDYGRARGLDVFDTSARLQNLRSVEVSVCSSQGLFLLLDKRIYTDPTMNRDGDRVAAHLRTYRDGFEWQPLAESFEAEIRRNWRGRVQVERPEAIGSVRALPDGIKSCDE
jgi:hypothetical protein